MGIDYWAFLFQANPKVKLQAVQNPESNIDRARNAFLEQSPRITF